jgi:hypothetical protein
MPRTGGAERAEETFAAGERIAPEAACERPLLVCLVLVVELLGEALA